MNPPESVPKPLVKAGATGRVPAVPGTYWIESLGCPKNQVDSDKVAGTLLAGGLLPATAPDEADLVVARDDRVAGGAVGVCELDDRGHD